MYFCVFVLLLLAVGKVGAMFGTFTFAYISVGSSFGTVMALSSALALAGAALTCVLSGHPNIRNISFARDGGAKSNKVAVEI